MKLNIVNECTATTNYRKSGEIESMNYANAMIRTLSALVVAIGVVIVASASVSAQTPLTEWPPEANAPKPCKYFEERTEKLEWEARKDKENRFRFFWLMRNQEGQTGQCNPLKGFPDSCERVTWIARVMSKRELTGWTFPDRAQAVYIFEGGVSPSDFCIGDN